MRRYLIAGAAIAALVPAAAASATSPPEPTEPTETSVVSEPSVVAETSVVEQGPPETDVVVTETSIVTEGATEAEPATIYDDSGNAVASITVTGSETDVTDYEDGNDPDDGRAYVRVLVTVESLITEGTFGINVEDFTLQDNNGFTTTGESVLTQAQAEAEEEVPTDVDLANGESVDMAVTFEVVESIGPQSVFWTGEDDRLVDVYEFASA